jgi:hypothetical protein
MAASSSSQQILVRFIPYDFDSDAPLPGPTPSEFSVRMSLTASEVKSRVQRLCGDDAYAFIRAPGAKVFEDWCDFPWPDASRLLNEYHVIRNNMLKKRDGELTEYLWLSVVLGSAFCIRHACLHSACCYRGLALFVLRQLHIAGASSACNCRCLICLLLVFITSCANLWLGMQLRHERQAWRVTARMLVRTLCASKVMRR